MPEIANFSIEKQDGPELCWAAAAKSVMDRYLPTKVSIGQHQLWTHYGKVRDGERVQRNDIAKVFKSMGALHSVHKLNGDPAEIVFMKTLGLKISDHIRKQQPVVCCIEGIGKWQSFKHCLVIWKILEQPSPEIHLKDPARPDFNLTANLDALMLGPWNYVTISQYDFLPAFASRFVFTEKPNAFSLSKTGIIES